MKILVNSGEFSLFSMNKCDICRLEVHGVEVNPLHCQLVPGRLVGSKKSPVALSDAVSTSVRCFAKRFERIHNPRRDESGFLCFVHRKYICLLKRYLFYRDNNSLQFLFVSSVTGHLLAFILN